MLAMVFDTETTDLITTSARTLDKQPHVIEFYGRLVDDMTGELKDELTFLCDPGVALSADVQRITGLKDEDLKGKPDFASQLPAVQALLAKADCVVAHNLSYDKQMLEFEAQRAKQPIVWPQRLICTVESTEHLCGFRLSLTALHEWLFQQAFDGAHRAKSDVLALTACYLELRKRGEI